MTERMMSLCASIRGLGYHASAWRHPDVDAAGSERFTHFLGSAKIAEAACFDAIFFADGLAIRANDKPPGSLCRSHENVELEPITLLAALSSVTDRIGLVATASTTYNHPYHIARKYASLDHISGGRAGWNVVTSWSDQEALNFGLDQQIEKAQRYERASEFVDVVLGLWRSWDADAFIRDKESGIFFEKEKMHTLNHSGKYFKVQGPLTSSRTPQGRPVLFQAGASEKGIVIAGRYADAVYIVPLSLEVAKEQRATIRNKCVEFGRSADSIRVLPGINIICGRNAQEARDNEEYQMSLVDPLVALSQLEARFGDLSMYDLDKPLPQHVFDTGKLTTTSNLFQLAKREAWTLKRICQAVGMGQVLTLKGSYDAVTQTMAKWFIEGGADGFNILPSYLPGVLEDIAENIVPRLQDMGLFRKFYIATTLRGHLGLPDPTV